MLLHWQKKSQSLVIRQESIPERKDVCCELRSTGSGNKGAIIFIDELDAVGTKRFDSELSGDREVGESNCVPAEEMTEDLYFWTRCKELCWSF